MGKKGHALLSASGSNRWMHCPPSARLEENIKEETSEYAKEGTFAHELGELHINLYLGKIKKTQFNKELKNLKKDSFYSEELMEYVQVYIDFAIEKIDEARATTKDAVVMAETKLDFSEWVPEGFGTGDLVIITDDRLEIIDFKFGQGVPVSAQGNTQMRLYSLGAIQQFGCLYSINTIGMTIVQPRLYNISTDEISVDDLINWAETELKPKAQLAINGEGEFLPGEHCKFCRAKGICRARAEEHLAMAKYDFKMPALLSDEEISEVLSIADRLSEWAKDVYSYASNLTIQEGKQWTGFKLVEGRSNRKYSSEEAVIKACNDNGITDIYTKSLLGITAMEKFLGKKKFNSILGTLVEKPQGKPTLVPISDKRQAIKVNSTAEADFKEEI